VNQGRIIPVDEKLPIPGVRVIVVCKEFRCLGYIDDKKAWHFDSNDKEIEHGVIAWEPYL
jgi:hypothetical protein